MCCMGVVETCSGRTYGHFTVHSYTPPDRLPEFAARVSASFSDNSPGSLFEILDRPRSRLMCTTFTATQQCRPRSPGRT
jgi:hypothetical protein